MAALPDADELLTLALRAVGSPTVIGYIASITALADCVGPRGPYTTEIRSARGDRLAFRQTWPDRPTFAGFMNGAHAWTRDESDGSVAPLDRASAAMIRSHEFQMLALEMPSRFMHHALLGHTEFAGTLAHVIGMRDELGNPCHAYFRLDDHLWAGMVLGDAPDIVRVVINEWRSIGKVRLPSRVTAADARGKYVFRFHTITLNTVDETLFAVPPDLATDDDTASTP